MVMVDMVDMKGLLIKDKNILIKLKKTKLRQLYHIDITFQAPKPMQEV
jgi:hypothetical protein